MIPLTLTGTEFEDAITEACAKLPGVSLTRNGTKSLKVTDKELTALAATSNNPAIRGRKMFKSLDVPSLVDFTIHIAPLGQGRNLEAKVSGTPSFPMNADKIKASQIEHMLRDDDVGVPGWLIVHWTERKGIQGNTLDAAMTTAIPVGDRFHPRWRNFVSAFHVWKKLKRKDKNVKMQPQPSITREEALREGVRIGWIIPPGCRNAVPDLAALLGVRVEKPAQGDLF